MKKTFITGVLLCSLLTLPIYLLAATFHSAQSGQWHQANTWLEAGAPGPNDVVIIQAGHVVQLNGGAYTHYADLTILEGGELIANTGNYKNGFTFAGPNFHVFGKFSLPFPDKDLTITDNSLFWGHPSADIFISDDWIAKGNSTIIVEGICVEVDDDFHIEGKQARVCGNGGVSIGNGANANTFNLVNGASKDQLCLQTNVYRGIGGSCDELVAMGSGNQLPIANNDQVNTSKNTPLKIDLLYLGTADYDPDPGTNLQIFSFGFDATKSDGLTEAGGQLLINDSGSPQDPSDDYVGYTPPADFVGLDSFAYVISDQDGGFATAWVFINVTDALPIDLSSFTAQTVNCQTLLKWTTESELDNEYFDLEYSTDGSNFKYLATIEGAGTSQTQQQYDYLHPQPQTPHYYRIKQVDFDGQFSYSKIIVHSTNCGTGAQKMEFLNIFPNPVFDQDLQIQFQSTEAIELPLMIVDAAGKIWKESLIRSQGGQEQIALNLQELPSGLYAIRLGQQSKTILKSSRQ